MIGFSKRTKRMMRITSVAATPAIRWPLLLILSLLQSGLVTSKLRHLQSTVDLVTTTNEAIAPVPGDVQGIRGGFSVEAPSWFVFFDRVPVCGGALIHPDIILTSATCVDKGIPGAVRVGAGTRTGGTSVGIEAVRIHPDWNGNILDGADIAILKLKSPVENEVALINNDGSVPVVTSDLLFVMGFGVTSNANTVTTYLQGLFVNYVEDCFSRLPPYNPEYFVCGDATPNYGTCAGDGGSPVVLAGTKNVVGVNSFSDGDCETQTIDVYTRVSSYSGWIEDQICEISAASKPKYCSAGKQDRDCLFFHIFEWFW